MTFARPTKEKEKQEKAKNEKVKHTLEYTNLVSCSFRNTNTHRFLGGQAHTGICKPCQSVVHSESALLKNLFHFICILDF